LLAQDLFRRSIGSPSSCIFPPGAYYRREAVTHFEGHAMSLRLITAPTDFPVSLTEAKKQCRVDGTDEDGALNIYIAAATAHVESITGRAIMAQTWELLLDDFADAILIPKGPVQSVTSVTYYDTDDVLQTLATDQYTLDNVSDPAWVVRPQSVTYPDVADGVNNVIVRFVAGYSTVPAELKAAILVLIASWFDNRSTAEIPLAVHSLLTNHRSF
jgi:uncharacterized phiE125 gp8 family phage protein